MRDETVFWIQIWMDLSFFANLDLYFKNPDPSIFLLECTLKVPTTIGTNL